MPAPDLDRLHTDPSSLLTWLDQNLLISAYLDNVNSPTGLTWATLGGGGLARINGVFKPAVAVSSNGRPIDVYGVRSNGTSAQDGIRAYVCNYDKDGVNSVILGQAADFCFTITLNGCTFGVGQAAGDGSRRVSHANTSTNSAAQGGQTVAQRTQTWNEHGTLANSDMVKMFEPALYRKLGGTPNLNATVFGIRTGRDWKFYFQVYQSAGPGQYRLIGVFPFAVQ